MNKKELKLNILTIVLYVIALIVGVVNLFIDGNQLGDLELLLVIAGNVTRIKMIEDKIWGKKDE